MTDNDAVRSEGGLIVVEGRMVARTLNELERAAKVCIAMEQRKPLPDNALIAVLCDTVRLVREYSDMASYRTAPRTSEQLSPTPETVK